MAHLHLDSALVIEWLWLHTYSTVKCSWVFSHHNSAAIPLFDRFFSFLFLSFDGANEAFVRIMYYFMSVFKTLCVVHLSSK